MKHIKLNGVNLQSVGYNAITRQMEATFVKAPSWVYVFERVPLTMYVEIVTADRPGPVFYQMVRSRPDLFPFTRKHL